MVRAWLRVASRILGESSRFCSCGSRETQEVLSPDLLELGAYIRTRTPDTVAFAICHAFAHSRARDGTSVPEPSQKVSDVQKRDGQLGLCGWCATRLESSMIGTRKKAKYVWNQ